MQYLSSETSLLIGFLTAGVRLGEATLVLFIYLFWLRLVARVTSLLDVIWGVLIKGCSHILVPQESGCCVVFLKESTHLYTPVLQ